jgi:hypothetical protein
MKKRKPMTPEQREAAAQRLVKARAARKVSDKGVHEDVRALDENDPMGVRATKEKIAKYKEKLTSIKSFRLSNQWQERLEYQSNENFIKNLETYLRTGVYKDLFFDLETKEKMLYRCYAKAYDEEGMVKRNAGTWYDDYGLFTKDDKYD